MRTQRNNTKSIDTANNEWPEILKLASRLSPANANPTATEVNVDKSLSAQDLKHLKKRDPFLYYSIPGVRDATIRLEHADVDMHQIAQNGLKRCCQTSFTSEPVAKVKRCTRISFEYPADMLLDLDELTDDLADMNMGKASEDCCQPDDDYLSDDAFLFKSLEERS
uniref:Uncharacterized protein n=1 Tax=Skeletonema marinoi TaxID=267567 RepID=A0A7S2L8L5_9STRA|mmetsp:Transcript_21580/g.36658  ORF Transcript_21580/g.36658 Transcript_21580/m.36658 type:complete len:166 (+) Transcript_21580:396-893(+)